MHQVISIDWGDLLMILLNVLQIVHPKRCFLAENQEYCCLPRSISQWALSYGMTMEEVVCLGERLVHLLKLYCSVHLYDIFVSC